MTSGIRIERQLHDISLSPFDYMFGTRELAAGTTVVAGSSIEIRDLARQWAVVMSVSDLVFP